MTDPISIATGLTSIKAAIDITKTLADARDTSKLLSVKLELQGLLLEAQEAQFALAAQKRELEERIRELEASAREKERYQLTYVGDGTLAYTLKPETQGSEPAHMACANCFEHGKRRVLQQRGYADHEHGTALFVCPDCAAQIVARTIVPTPLVARAPGEPCPSCGAYEFRVSKTAPTKGHWGDMGCKDVTKKCTACKFEDVEMVTPK